MQETQNVDLEKQIAALQEQLRKKNDQQGQKIETPVVHETPQPKEATSETVGGSVESVSKGPGLPIPLPPKPPTQGAGTSLKWLDVPFFMAEDISRSYELPNFAPLLEPFQKEVEILKKNLETSKDLKAFSKNLVEMVDKIMLTHNQAAVDAFHDWLVEKEPELVKYFCEGVV